MKRCFSASLAMLLSITMVFMPAMASATGGTPMPGIDPKLVRTAAVASDLDSLSNVPIPSVDNLHEFLNPGKFARSAAVILGKALFWDMQTGSDGQACGTCHFHAGADSRARNQLSPGIKSVPEDTLFGNNFLGVDGFPQFRPDYTLVPEDFPFHVLEDPEENNFNLRVVLKDTNDVASSMGVFAADFVKVLFGNPNDVGTPFVDLTFNIDNPFATLIENNVRRVEPRNTPTMINAVFNHSNFMDGRAHNLFNGVSVIGPLDPNAVIYVASPWFGKLVPKKVSIPNSSLASQAVGPPVSNLEMSFFDRPFRDVGRKLLSLRPLGLQKVHPEDSVLGKFSRARLGMHGSMMGEEGLNISYSTLIKLAFQPKYWASPKKLDGYSQMEVNFSLFFGLAVQLYESTLISDKTPFDRFMNGDNMALSQEQLQGLLVFLNRGERGNVAEVDAAIAQALGAGIAVGAGNCISCHGGPEFTDAAFSSLAGDGELELIEIEDTTVLDGGLLAVSPVQGLLDNGFSNIGVRPTNDDLGRGGIEGGFPPVFHPADADFP